MAAEQRKQPRKILTEEDYTSTLTHIVTRDYYPSLYSLRRDAAILEARSKGDVATAVAIRREARREEIQREQELLEDQAEELDAYNGDLSITSVNNMQQVTGTRKRPRPLKHESITGFHARVTSEDNAEFESNQEIEKKQRETNLGIIYSSAADKTGRLAIEAAVNGNGKTLANDTNNRALLGCETPLGLASDLFNPSPSAGLRITGSENQSAIGVGRNGLFFQPQHISEKDQTQKGQLLLESSNTTNNPTGNFLAITDQQTTSDDLLMPPPPARRSDSLCVIASKDTNATQKSNLPLPTYQLVEYQPKPLVPHINPPATRFPNQAESRLLATSSVSANRSRPSMNGDTSDATTDLDEIPRPLDDERAARREAAMREYETFVPMTPLIQPGRGGGVAADAVDDEPIMTWGTVASTPLVLGNGAAVDKNSTSAPGDWEPTQPFPSSECDFDIMEENNREKLAHRAEKKLSNRAKIYKSAGSRALLEKTSTDVDFDDASIRSGASSVASKGTVSINFDRSASLTPAGRALLKANTTSWKSGSNIQKTSYRSRIFQTSSVSSKRPSAASRDSFGSALRSAYSQSSTPSRITKKKPGHSASLSRRAAEGGTPRITR